MIGPIALAIHALFIVLVLTSEEEPSWIAWGTSIILGITAGILLGLGI